ncbi:hypothetical protein FFI87_015440 [Burkholderia sp. KBS0801]|nr:hypothetical protein FFI87_015440 [Burkholderia sp. KBS0801]
MPGDRARFGIVSFASVPAPPSPVPRIGVAPRAPFPFPPRFFGFARLSAHRFFLSGGLTRTSSSALISGHLARTVPSTPDLRRTPAEQGWAAFVTGSATRGGTR